MTNITNLSVPVYFAAECIGLKLFENATFMGYSLDSSYNVIDNKVITLTKDQYLEWKKYDDNYIINLVSQEIGKNLMKNQEILETVNEDDMDIEKEKGD